MVRLWYTVLLAAAPLASAQQAFETLFYVDYSTNNNGGCNYVGSAKLNHILRDAYTLAQKGVELSQRVYNNPGLGGDHTRLFNAWFGNEETRTQAEVNTVYQNYKIVRDWIRDGGLVMGRKPKFYCNDSFVRRVTLDMDALDANGQFQVDVYGRRVKWRNIGHVASEVQRLATTNGVSASSQSILVGWVADFRSIMVTHVPGSQGVETLCVGTHQGFSDRSPNFAYVLLCPRAFEAPDNGGPWAYNGLRADTSPIRPQRYSLISQNDQLLIDFTGPAWVLLHELFHLIAGLEKPPGYPKEIYDTPGMLNAPYAAALNNPETYVMVAGAWHITTKFGYDAQGYRVEGFSGYITLN